MKASAYCMFGSLSAVMAAPRPGGVRGAAPPPPASRGSPALPGSIEHLPCTCEVERRHSKDENQQEIGKGGRIARIVEAQPFDVDEERIGARADPWPASRQAEGNVHDLERLYNAQDHHRLCATCRR